MTRHNIYILFIYFFKCGLVFNFNLCVSIGYTVSGGPQLISCNEI